MYGRRGSQAKGPAPVGPCVTAMEADGADGTDGAYVLEIKSSAKRASAEAGEWVNREGPLRAFDSEAAARRWARAMDAEGNVWVQGAAPADRSGVDGYLVGGRRPSAREPPGEQAELDGVRPGSPDDDGTGTLHPPERAEVQRRGHDDRE